MPQKDSSTINRRLDSIERTLGELKGFDERIGKVIEDKVFEIKGVAYVTLIMVGVLLALVLGALVKAFFG